MDNNVPGGSWLLVHGIGEPKPLNLGATTLLPPDPHLPGPADGTEVQTDLRDGLGYGTRPPRRGRRDGGSRG